MTRGVLRPVVMELVGGRLPSSDRKPLVVGICGAQGCGKSTLATSVVADAQCRGLSAATLSLDDLYLTKSQREALGASVHPLLRTRGVPGTHDVARGMALFDDLDAGLPVCFPRFDKAIDDRAAKALWPIVDSPLDLLVFEGWFVGARPQPGVALDPPLNSLERDHDPNGSWRRFVNDSLGGYYQRLFARIDILILLAAPGWDVVDTWRIEQEHGLRASALDQAKCGMSDEAVRSFTQHYERLTRFILEEMPVRTDLTAYLGPDRAVQRVVFRPS